jgi:hypothetical protein
MPFTANLVTLKHSLLLPQIDTALALRAVFGGLKKLVEHLLQVLRVLWNLGTNPLYLIDTFV